MLGGTNLEIYKVLTQISGLNITASGGISSVDEIETLSRMGLWGAILGKALYEGKINLKAALKAGG
jgi:phosphoribosylformimino-5-aminoimidazole carboxamide ribotide isomerase